MRELIKPVETCTITISITVSGISNFVMFSDLYEWYLPVTLSQNKRIDNEWYLPASCSQKKLLKQYNSLYSPPQAEKNGFVRVQNAIL